MKSLLLLLSVTSLTFFSCSTEEPPKETAQQDQLKFLIARSLKGPQINPNDPKVGQKGSINVTQNASESTLTFDLTGLGIPDSTDVSFKLKFYANASNAASADLKLNSIEKNIEVPPPVWVAGWDKLNTGEDEFVETPGITISGNSLVPTIPDDPNNIDDYVFHTSTIGYAIGYITYTNSKTSKVTTLEFEGEVSNIDEKIVVEVTSVIVP